MQCPDSKGFKHEAGSNAENDEDCAHVETCATWPEK